MTPRLLLITSIFLLLLNCESNHSSPTTTKDNPISNQQATAGPLQTPHQKETSEPPEKHPAFDAFKALFPPLVLPYATDSLDHNTNGKTIGTQYGDFLKYGFSNIEALGGAVPRYSSIGQFEINSSLLGLVYYCDGWYGQAGSNDQIILGIYNPAGKILDELLLYDNEGYMYDYADGDGIGDSSTVLFSAIDEGLSIRTTKITDHYTGYQDSVSWEPLIKRDTIITNYTISPEGRVN
jgi:hypothetical protein